MRFNKLVKAGLIGVIITTILSILLYLLFSVSLKVLAPFYMPWAVLALIGITNNNNRPQ
ncbi:MAG: hypothetical protein NTX97_07145 [Bacteroidetes bacterium]|nr:hypothetical protein [Bacteroidota bacterium]